MCHAPRLRPPTPLSKPPARRLFDCRAFSAELHCERTCRAVLAEPYLPSRTAEPYLPSRTCETCRGASADFTAPCPLASSSPTPDWSTPTSWRPSSGSPFRPPRRGTFKAASTAAPRALPKASSWLLRRPVVGANSAIRCRFDLSRPSTPSRTSPTEAGSLPRSPGEWLYGVDTSVHPGWRRRGIARALRRRLD